MNSYCDITALDGSGSMKAYLAMPAGKPKAGIVVIQEVLGVNKDVRAMADVWAEKGYAAIAPDLFWRLKPGVDDPSAEFYVDRSDPNAPRDQPVRIWLKRRVS